MPAAVIESGPELARLFQLKKEEGPGEASGPSDLMSLARSTVVERVEEE